MVIRIPYPVGSRALRRKAAAAQWAAEHGVIATLPVWIGDDRRIVTGAITRAGSVAGWVRPNFTTDEYRFEYSSTGTLDLHAERLTRAQIAALTVLHRDGELSGQGRGIGVPGVRQSTLNALVHAELAGQDPNNGRRFVPVLHTWADGYGVWHVQVPTAIYPEDRERVARAALRGEHQVRQGAEAPLPRVAADMFPDGYYTATIGGTRVVLYGEV